MLTLEQFANATECPMMRAEPWHAPIVNAMSVFDINTPLRMAMFLAQVSHESGRFVYRREIWGPTEAQKRYEGRLDLGNTQAGDGKRFMGRGPIQVTGRANYISARNRLRERYNDTPDFEKEPERLEEPIWGARAAADFWFTKGLNALADAGDIERVTKRINGGLNGIDDRKKLYSGAKKVLGIA